VTDHAILIVARFRRFLVTHSDGTSEYFDYDGGEGGIPPGRSANHYAIQAWDRTHPPMGLYKPNDPVRDARDAWLREAAVTEERGWEAAWCDSSGQSRLDVAVDTWHWGVPGPAIVTLLDRYGAEGWKVAHVSEDRGVYRGADVAEESYVTRVRYLLVRDGGRSQPTPAHSA
jgi:hypothetical protein